MSAEFVVSYYLETSIMLIENTHSVSEQDNAAQKKPWQTPQCSSKNWKTPRLSSLPFNQTSGGSTPGPEHSAPADVS